MHLLNQIGEVRRQSTYKPGQTNTITKVQAPCLLLLLDEKGVINDATRLVLELYNDKLESLLR